MLLINDQTADRSFSVFSTVGHNAYVSSFTTRTEKLSASFGDAAIEVFEPVGFCTEIANEIPGSLSMMMGQCIYADTRILESMKRGPEISEFLDASGQEVSLDKMMSKASGISGPKEFFLKERKYEDQMEFRLVWETNKPVIEPLLVKIKEPHRFCRRL